MVRHECEIFTWLYFGFPYGVIPSINFTITPLDPCVGQSEG